MTAFVDRFIGVYAADGGVRGEARYALGKILGTAHCALCDITHSLVRRKREWDEMAHALGVPFNLVHRNELPPTLLPAADLPLPAVFALAPKPIALLTASDLDDLAGSVDSFAILLRKQLQVLGLTLP
ncbi:MAG: hypothetical protein ACRC0L_07095 [Angustibacter sp.]